MANPLTDSDKLYQEAEKILDQYKLSVSEKHIWLDAVRDTIE